MGVLTHRVQILQAAVLGTVVLASHGSGADQSAAPLPDGVRAVWDLDKAQRETTPTRERISINGLWRWQPAKGDTNAVPPGTWGHFKVPGCWPGISDYMQKDCQTVYTHPSWAGERLGGITAAWYQREITVPAQWAGRRIALYTEYLNSYAAVFVDGKRAGEMRFPAGEVDITSACRPGGKHVLSLLVVAMPLKGVMLSYTDSNSARSAKGRVERRGLCGDVYFIGEPAGPRIADVKVDTSVRKWEIAFSAALRGLAADQRYTLHARITEGSHTVAEFTSKEFQGRFVVPASAGRAASTPPNPLKRALQNDIGDDRITFTERWKPTRLWDIHTPQNIYQVTLSLADAGGKVLDTAHPERFGFREFWIDGRDFYLNGSRIFLSALPLDNAQVSAAAAGYEGAKESLLRLKQIGINFVYTHNYGCEPGSHLGFAEILRAADDVGMLVSLSQPHFAQYDWTMPAAEETNGYAQHARFYCRAAGSHPSVVFYSMSHNATGYDEDMNPDLIDGIHSPRNQWSANNVKRALLAEAIVTRLDPGRIVYHHSSGNLSSMHTSNFYTNMAPAQELDDWFEHWATKGVKPLFTCEYMVPCTWDWTMYRGWYKGVREFGSAPVPWEFCVAEWSAQFLGDRAYRVSEAEKKNLRWEAEQFRRGRLWHRWDYPYQVGSPVFESQHTIIGRYLADNWRAFRTWGVSAISPWEHHFFWTLRDGVDKSRKPLETDWENLQRPGFSPDYLGERYERMDMAFERSDWIPTADGEAILRNNGTLLAYIGGKPGAFTSKDHNFYPGETVEKQIIVVNNSREPARYEYDSVWSDGARGGFGFVLHDETGQQSRLPLKRDLPSDMAPGTYGVTVVVKFSSGQSQNDRFVIHVMPRSAAPRVAAKIASWDRKGESTALLTKMGIQARPVEVDTDVTGYDVLVVGKRALTADGPGPDLGRVRDGLKVIVFEQDADVLEKRLGFRVAEYGLRQVFPRVPDHPLLAGLEVENLRDWRGEATLQPPRLKGYAKSDRVGGPIVKWRDIEVPHVWRCGNRGNVASVLIEKPARGDFLPILDGGYSLQYSPLMEYREGKGLVLFCQLDVTGRTETDPAAEHLARNIMQYVAAWKPQPRRTALYAGDPAGMRHLERAGIAAGSYEGGKLSPDQVLIVGPGGGRDLVAHAARVRESREGGNQTAREPRTPRAAVADWLSSGGHLLAVGLDESDANAILPFKVAMKKEEHIAGDFAPFPKGSPFAGIGPADVHNRDPRVVPLVSGRATVIGDGVLAKAEQVNVVFFQLAPWEFDNGKQHNLKQTYRRVSFALSRLMAGMGVADSTPLLARFNSPVIATGPEKRWLDGLYLDQPEEWDDPYRFFRW